LTLINFIFSIWCGRWGTLENNMAFF
jgi:hypothetical protein